MKFLKLYEDDIFDDEDWDFEEDYYEELQKGDWIIFLPNPQYRHYTNFATREVVDIKENYILIDGDYKIFSKNNIYYRKLHIKKSWDLKSGDYFFNKEDYPGIDGNSIDRLRNHVYIVTNVKLGGIICNIQPLNYNAGRLKEHKLMRHDMVLVPDEETKKEIDKKIDRIKKYENL